jgi:hypothetical protein
MGRDQRLKISHGANCDALKEGHVKSTWVVGSWFLAILLVSVTSVHSQTKTSNMASDLAGTSWRLVKFQGSDGTTLRSTTRGGTRSPSRPTVM